MNFNTILYRLGTDPSNFINEDDEPIKTPKGYIYEVIQRTDIRKCPYCNSDNVIIHNIRPIEINCSETDHIEDILRIKKVRFKCKSCNKTFTPTINGIERYSKTNNQTLSMIVRDFSKLITFKDIAIRYGLTTSRIMQIFDEKIKFVSRKPMPFVLCIDEISFSEELDQNYCCVLYDFDNRNIVDIVKNRRLDYLNEYFSSIPESERNYTKYFVSDMYDAYKTVKRKYFPKALHIIDLFHVVSQLTRAVSKARIKAMNENGGGTIEYNFMKSHWRLFICRKENIPDKFYTLKKTGEIYHLDEMVFNCILRKPKLIEVYNILQDLYHYNEYFFSFGEAFEFVMKLVKRLELTNEDVLIEVADTYRKWAPEIANGLAKNQNNKHYTNGIAESINNHLITIIKTAYGYHNFDRFRRRVLVIKTYKKDLG